MYCVKWCKNTREKTATDTWTRTDSCDIIVVRHICCTTSFFGLIIVITCYNRLRMCTYPKTLNDTFENNIDKYFQINLIFIRVNTIHTHTYILQLKSKIGCFPNSKRYLKDNVNNLTINELKEKSQKELN